MQSVCEINKLTVKINSLFFLQRRLLACSSEALFFFYTLKLIWLARHHSTCMLKCLHENRVSRPSAPQSTVKPMWCVSAARLTFRQWHRNSAITEGRCSSGARLAQWKHRGEVSRRWREKEAFTFFVWLTAPLSVWRFTQQVKFLWRKPTNVSVFSNECFCLAGRNCCRVGCSCCCVVKQLLLCWLFNRKSTQCLLVS